MNALKHSYIAKCRFQSVLCAKKLQLLAHVIMLMAACCVLLPSNAATADVTISTKSTTFINTNISLTYRNCVTFSIQTAQNTYASGLVTLHSSTNLTADRLQFRLYVYNYGATYTEIELYSISKIVSGVTTYFNGEVDYVVQSYISNFPLWVSWSSDGTVVIGYGQQTGVKSMVFFNASSAITTIINYMSVASASKNVINWTISASYNNMTNDVFTINSIIPANGATLPPSSNADLMINVRYNYSYDATTGTWHNIFIQLLPDFSQVRWLMFQAAMCNSLTVVLAPSNAGNDSSPAYIIKLYTSSYSYISKTMTWSYSEMSNTYSRVTCGVYRWYWISWNNVDCIAAGWGSTVGYNVMAYFGDIFSPYTPIRSVALYSYDSIYGTNFTIPGYYKDFLQVTTTSPAPTTVEPTTSEIITTAPGHSTSHHRSTITSMLTTEMIPATAITASTTQAAVTAAITTSPVVPRVCSPAPDKNNADFVVYRTRFGQIAVYTCHYGFQFLDGTTSKSMLCVASEWLPDLGSCKAMYCSSETTTLLAGEYVKRNCQSGTGAYVNSGLTVEVLKCIVTGTSATWNSPMSDCRVGACQPAPAMLNAKAVFDPLSRIVTYTCQPGHRFSSGKQEASYKCHDNGEWNWDEIGRCLSIYCPALHVPENGAISTTRVDYQTTVTVRCNDGFMFPDRNLTFVVQCVDASSSSSLVWNDTIVDCQPVYCNDPPTIDYGFRSSVQPPVTIANQYRRGTVVTYTCSSGRRFEDGTTVKNVLCTNVGLWNETVLTCDINRCNPVPRVAHATSSTSNALKDQTVNYTCDPGYTFPPNCITSITCDGSVWSTRPPNCTELLCPLPTVKNANVSSSTSTFTFGSTINVQCHDGYSINQLARTQTVVTCDGGGRWQPASVACSPVDCGPAPLVPHSRMTSSMFSTTYLEKLTYTCDKGYSFAREVFATTITCQRDGTWSPADALNCTAVNCLPLTTSYVVNTTSRTYLTAVNVTCNEHHKFSSNDDESFYVLSVCDSRGQWQPTVPECEAVSGVTGGFSQTTVEASHSVDIGIVICVVISLLLAVVVALDIPTYKKSLSELKAMLKDRL